jgi:hypothetical protein
MGENRGWGGEGVFFGIAAGYSGIFMYDTPIFTDDSNENTSLLP